MEGEVGGGSLPFVLSLLPVLSPCCLLQPHAHLLSTAWNLIWSPCQVPLMVVPHLICLSNVWHVVALNYFSVLRLFPLGSPGIVYDFCSISECLPSSIPPLPISSLPSYLAWHLKFVWLYSYILAFVDI